MSQEASSQANVIALNTFTLHEGADRQALLALIEKGIRTTSSKNPGFLSDRVFQSADGKTIINMSEWTGGMEQLAANHKANEASLDYQAQMTEVGKYASFTATANTEVFAYPDATGANASEPASLARYQERLTPEQCVLVLVDLLTGFDPGLRTIDRDRWDKNVTAFTRLAGIFAKRTPVLVLGDEGGFRGQFYPQIAENVPDAPRFARHTPSAMQAQPFRDALAATGRRRIVIGGISLDLCTMHTSLDMLKAGYEVYVLVDCSGTESELVQTAAMLRLTQAGAVMTNWVSLASELMGDWNTPEGEAVGKLYQELSAWGGK